jgi:hypothetical protein
MAGRISEWQRRLDDDGKVQFRQSPWLALLGLALSGFLVFGGLDGITGEGVRVWSVAVLVLGAAGVVLAVRSLVTGTPGLVVTQDGVRSGRGPVVPLDHIAAVVARGRTLTIDHRPVTGQRLTGRQRRSGFRQLTTTLSPVGGAPAGDLALWLFQLQGGPDARVDVTRRRGRFGELYQPAAQPWWER